MDTNIEGERRRRASELFEAMVVPAVLMRLLGGESMDSFPDRAEQRLPTGIASLNSLALRPCKLQLPVGLACTVANEQLLFQA